MLSCTKILVWNWGYRITEVSFTYRYAEIYSSFGTHWLTDLKFLFSEKMTQNFETKYF